MIQGIWKLDILTPVYCCRLLDGVIFILFIKFGMYKPLKTNMYRTPILDCRHTLFKTICFKGHLLLKCTNMQMEMPSL